MKHCFTLVLLLHSLIIFSQDEKASQIIKTTSDYFLLDRENIHLHLDKNVFFTNEIIWLKGYIYDRKKNQPFYNTINVYAALIDNTGKVIDTKLLYGNLGCFTGYFKTGESFKSGRYYIQVYTNWMNNFTEDESFTEEVTIINESDNPASHLYKKKYSELSIKASPEGGSYVKGIANNFGISVSACDGTPASLSNVDILDKKGKVITTVHINRLGNGRLELAADAEPAKIVATVGGKRFESAFPEPDYKGFALSVNNYSMANTSLITINTNQATAANYINKPLYLLIHKDDKASVYIFKIDSKNINTVLPIQSSEISEGLNTIRLLDENLQELAVRMIYKYPATGISTIISQGKQTENGLQFTGNVVYPGMNISISVLPENTICADISNDIYGSLWIAPYLKDRINPAGRHYFATLSKGRHYELDIFLLSQKPKYSWQNILHNPPKQVFTFDMGITVKGKVPTGFSFGEKDKVQMIGRGNISEYVDINQNREFEVDHLVIPDSAWVKFYLAKVKGNTRTPLSIIPQTSNTGTVYFKPYKPVPLCDLDTINEIYTAPEIFHNTVMLDAVTVPSSKLKYNKSFGNHGLRSYKVTNSMGGGSLLLWIRNNTNFNVTDNITNVSITTRMRTSINGGPSTPLVYIDNILQRDLTILNSIFLDDADEIYVNEHYIIPSVGNNYGVIKIYLKKDVRRTGNTTTGPDVVIKNGFQSYKTFENVNYASTSDTAYQNFGILAWHPTIISDEKGAFRFEIPNTGQKTIRLLIEGISPDGKLISEEKIVTAQ